MRAPKKKAPSAPERDAGRDGDRRAEGRQGAEDSGHRRLRRPAGSPGVSTRRLPTSRSSPSSTSPTMLRAWSAPTATTGTSSFTEILNTEKPDIVVGMFGANDRQQMKISNQRLADPLGQLGEDLCPARRRHRRYAQGLWPAVLLGQRSAGRRAPAVSGDMAYLNGLYKPRVEGGRRYLRRRLGRLHQRGWPVHRAGVPTSRARRGAAHQRRHQFHPRRPAEARLLCRNAKCAGRPAPAPAPSTSCLDKQAEPDRGRTRRQEALGRPGHLAVRSAAGRRAIRSPARRSRRSTTRPTGAVQASTSPSRARRCRDTPGRIDDFV